LDELDGFVTDLFTQKPPNFEKAWEQVKYKSKATHGREAVDITGLLLLLYVLVKPDGKYHPDVYKQRQRTSIASLVSVHEAPVVQHPKRFENIDVSAFHKGKSIGKGSQGEVFRGQYQGIDCAGKIVFGDDPVKVGTSVCVCVCVYVLYAYKCACMCMYICFSVFIYACVCVHASLQRRHTPSLGFP
jgi:hypothetical protein